MNKKIEKGNQSLLHTDNISFVFQEPQKSMENLLNLSESFGDVPQYKMDYWALLVLNS